MTNDGMTNDESVVNDSATGSSFVIRHSSFANAPCPFLPEIDRIYKAADVHALGADRGPVFYETSLCYAQSQWRVGLPAQAMLQLNRALACCLPLDEPVLHRWPLPYTAMAWIIQQRPEGQFIGNPRRHFQHLATRMVPPHKELRTWRAWACWYLSKVLLPEEEHPADWKQIRQEGVVEPTFHQIREQLHQLSPADDEAKWLEALAWAGFAIPEPSGVTFEPVSTEHLHVVHQLAHAIWPRVYPGIISEAQIDYMLRQRYELDVLRADVERGVRYALICLGGVGSVGAHSSHPLTPSPLPEGEGDCGGSDVTMGVETVPLSLGEPERSGDRQPQAARRVSDANQRAGVRGPLRSTPDYVGFIAFEPRTHEDDAFLHKLYILPEAAGQGIGAAALNWVSEQAAKHGLKRLRLFVNKRNVQAVRAYLRNGFIFDQDVITDIGEGFVMDDFVMVKHLERVKDAP